MVTLASQVEQGVEFFSAAFSWDQNRLLDDEVLENSRWGTAAIWLIYAVGTKLDRSVGPQIIPSFFRNAKVLALAGGGLAVAQIAKELLLQGARRELQDLAHRIKTRCCDYPMQDLDWYRIHGYHGDIKRKTEKEQEEIIQIYGEVKKLRPQEMRVVFDYMGNCKERFRADRYFSEYETGSLLQYLTISDCAKRFIELSLEDDLLDFFSIRELRTLFYSPKPHTLITEDEEREVFLSRVLSGSLKHKFWRKSKTSGTAPIRLSEVKEEPVPVLPVRINIFLCGVCKGPVQFYELEFAETRPKFEAPAEMKYPLEVPFCTKTSSFKATAEPPPTFLQSVIIMELWALKNKLALFWWACTEHKDSDIILKPGISERLYEESFFPRYMTLEGQPLTYKGFKDFTSSLLKLNEEKSRQVLEEYGLEKGQEWQKRQDWISMSWLRHGFDL